jgi:hypothetical protein
MAKQVLLTPEVAQEIREKLKLIKQAEDAVVKMAELEEELKVLRSVLSLVKRGSIAPYRCDEVAEEILNDPSQLNIYTEYKPKIGEMVDRSSSHNVTTTTIEDEFLTGLNKIIIGDM